MHFIGECSNAFLDELGIAKTEGATNRDSLEALCRRDATLITHEHSVDRFNARKEQKLFEAEEKLARSIQRASVADQQRSMDMEIISRLKEAVQQDTEACALDAANAKWKKLPIEVLKSFYRLLPDDERLSRMPKNKDEWIEFVRSKLPHCIEALA